MIIKNHPNKIKFCVLISIDIVLMLLDGLLTYINTPDLALEGNFLVARFGLGWGALFTANAITLAIVVYTLYYALFKYETLIVDAANAKEYLSWLFYNRPDKFIWSFYKFPKNWKPVLAVFGHALIYSAIVSRAILVCEWAFNLPAAYWSFRRSLFLNRVDVWVVVIVALFVIIYWFISEYKKSEKAKRQNSLR